LQEKITRIRIRKSQRFQLHDKWGFSSLTNIFERRNQKKRKKQRKEDFEELTISHHDLLLLWGRERKCSFFFLLQQRGKPSKKMIKNFLQIFWEKFSTVLQSFWKKFLGTLFLNLNFQREFRIGANINSEI